MRRSAVATAALGVSYMALKQWMGGRTRRIAWHAALAQHPEVLRRYPGLCEALQEVGTLGDGSDMPHLATCARKLYEVDVVTRTPLSQWQIATLNADIERHAEAACRGGSESDEAFRRTTVVREDVLPLLKTHLDAILHNHLLGT